MRKQKHKNFANSVENAKIINKIATSDSSTLLLMELCKYLYISAADGIIIDNDDLRLPAIASYCRANTIRA